MWENTELGDMFWRVRNLDPTRVFIKVSDGEVEKLVAELNRDQLRHGKNAKDTPLSEIGGEYSDLTLELHPEKTRFTITLFDTGEYYNSIICRTDNFGGWEITSDPIKVDFTRTTNLTDRWGKDIEGLTDENVGKVVTQLLIGKYIEYLEKDIL